jgi:carbon monoxide dehydrogenase subunit G
MELQHRFTVPAGIDDAWAHFLDIEGVAGCFPGATVTEAHPESFTGTVKVKLGPIALVYNGTGTFVEKDEAARRLVIDARGKDKRGNGTAGAMVTAVMTEAGPGSTEVSVDTDLTITGKAAQFGRGNVVQDVSDKLLGQFVTCLEQRLAASPGAPPEEGPAPAPGDGAAPEARPVATPDPEAPVPGSAGGVAPAQGSAVPDPDAPRAPRDDDAIDLGRTVLPVLARAYWKQALAVVVLVLAVVWLVTRG